MDSRDLLRGTSRFLFLYDSNSLNVSNECLEKLTYYIHYPHFHFLRTSGSTTTAWLKSIDEIATKDYSGDDTIKVQYKDHRGHIVKTRNFHPLEYSTQNIENPFPINDRNLRLVNIFNRVRETTNDDERAIFVTTNSEILENRRRLEYDVTLSNAHLNIATPSEAAEISGIYMRSKRDFVYYHSYNRGDSYKTGLMKWTMCLARLFLPHALDEGFIGSLLDRFDSLHISIDKAGEQYYSGADNHSDILTRYHFNNAISLLTGVTDVIALQIRDEYDLDIEDKRTNLKTGKNPVLRGIRDANGDLFEFIHRNNPLIELLHIIRNHIIHRKGIIKRGPGFSIHDDGKSKWSSQSIDLENLTEDQRIDFKKYYDQLDDSLEKYDPISEWGIICPEFKEPEITEHTSIEPYRFLKRATFNMANFSDGCLERLGKENRLDRLDDTGLLTKSDVERIFKYDLFPLLRWISTNPVE